MSKKHTSLVQFAKKINPDLPPVFAKAFGAITEVSAGIAKSSPSDAVTILLNVAQRQIRDEGLKAVAAEFEMLRKKGKTSSEYLHSLQGKYTYMEMLDFLDKGQVSDEDVFQVIKKIFLIGATKEPEQIAREFLIIAKGLTGGEVLVLMAAYRISTDPLLSGLRFGTGSVEVDKWEENISNQSSLKHKGLVRLHAAKLVEKGLLYPMEANRPVAYMGEHMRLQDLGYAFCQYISQYEEIMKEVTSEEK